MNKSQSAISAIDKIKEISKRFDVAETLVDGDVAEVIEDQVQEIISNKTEYNPIDIMSVEQMADDFKFSRETLQDVIRNGREVLDRATQDLLLAEGDAKAGSTMAFAELSSAILNGIKVHSSLYKDFSIVLLNIKKINETNAPTNVTNNLTITDNVTTTEIIERLKRAK